MTLPGRSNFRRVRFMGSYSGKLWWDVRWRGGWLVITAGRWKPHFRPALPQIYWSPDGTPGHPCARNVCRALVAA